MAIYQIGGQSIHSDDPALSELLANIYSSRERPLCLCRTPGIEMYVAKVDDKYLIKRMPNSGSGHAPRAGRSSHAAVRTPSGALR